MRHIFVSHLRVPRTLPLVLHRDGHFFSDMLRRLCQRSSRTPLTPGVTRIIVDSFPRAYCQITGMTTLLSSVSGFSRTARLNIGKMHFVARHPLISSERYQRSDSCVKKEILKVSDSNYYSSGSVGFMDRCFLINGRRAYMLEEVIRSA